MLTRAAGMRTVPGRVEHVVVVGAGLAGLSAALHLLGSGRRVTLVERADRAGGRAGARDLVGPAGTYRVDTGPTVLTMPHLLDDALGAVGERLADRLELRPVEPAYRARFADGSAIDVHTDAEAMAAEVRATCGPAAEEGYRALRRWLTRLYRAEIDRFIGANHDSPLGLLGPDLARLAALGGFGRLGPRIAARLPDERLQRLFSFQALYAGVRPDRALAAYAVISYMDTVGGVWFPRGGMRALGPALAGAATAAGATLLLGRTVTGLERRGGRVTAVRHGPTGAPEAPDRIPCDAVVLTPDLPVAYRLLGRVPRRPVPLQWAPSAVVLHAGSTRSWPGLGHHTLFFGAAWRRTFREIVDGPGLMSDPSLLLTRPTATDPDLAPAGRQLYCLLAPCPNTARAGIDWPRVGPAYAAELLAGLERRGLAGLAASVEATELVTPADWAAAGLAAGTPFSAAHTVAQTGPFRPRNLLRDPENAVLAGCGTTPGVGVPAVLISGRLAAQRIAGARRAGAPGQGARACPDRVVRAWAPT